MAVTGVGGFIGLRMTERALGRGIEVRGLELSEKAAGKARRAGARVIVGDVGDPQAARRLCEGADVVFHTAAVVKEGGSMELFRRVNVGGTHTVARAARRARAKRFVHLSSVMVYGFDFPRNVAEEGPLRGENNPYCQSKIESEQAAMGYHESGRLEVIAIRPGDVYGPGSVPWVVRPAQMLRRRAFPLIGGGRGIMNHVYIDNLLDAVFLALEKDATGEAFNVTDGRETSFADYFGRLARAAGAPRPLSLPAGLARPLFGAIERVFAALGKEPPASAQAIGFVTRPHSYSIEKARRVLGYEPRVSLEEGMQRVGEWLKEVGMA